MSANGYILCPGCSKDIGSVTRVLQYAIRGYTLENLKKHNIKPDKLNLVDNIVEPIGFILDAFSITNSCCRMYVMTAYDFHKKPKTYIDTLYP